MFVALIDKLLGLNVTVLYNLLVIHDTAPSTPNSGQHKKDIKFLITHGYTYVKRNIMYSVLRELIHIVLGQEFVAASISCTSLRGPVIFCAMYRPPDTMKELRNCAAQVVSQHPKQHVYIGGDTNLLGIYTKYECSESCRFRQKYFLKVAF